MEGALQQCLASCSDDGAQTTSGPTSSGLWQILEDHTFEFHTLFQNHHVESTSNFYQYAVVSYCFTIPQSKHWICSKGDHSIFSVVMNVRLTLLHQTQPPILSCTFRAVLCTTRIPLERCETVVINYIIYP